MKTEGASGRGGEEGGGGAEEEGEEATAGGGEEAEDDPDSGPEPDVRQPGKLGPSRFCEALFWVALG